MDLALAQLHFTEAEILCRLFANEYSLPVDEVLQVGLRDVLARYPNFNTTIAPSNESIRNLSLPSLKEEMRARNLKISGKKIELQLRLIREINRIKQLVCNIPTHESMGT